MREQLSLYVEKVCLCPILRVQIQQVTLCRLLFGVGFFLLCELSIGSLGVERDFLLVKKKTVFFSSVFAKFCDKLHVYA